jgi:hypothetical protein
VLKRKPQVTLSLTDKDGNRLYKAVDMGFGDPYWAKIKSQAIIDAMVKILPSGWRLVKIEYKRETAFTKYIERALKTVNSSPRYLVIRTWSESDNHVYSWFLINYFPDEGKVLDKLPVVQERLIRSIRELESTITNLFDVKMHLRQSEGKKAKRFSISKALRPQLVASRMEILIKKARKGEDHLLVEGVKQTTEFEERLARYIKADNPLIYRLKLLPIFLTLIKLRDKKEIITKDEVIKVIEKILEGGDWEKAGFYKGLPKHGTKRDEKQGGFLTYKGKHSALSVRIDDKARSAWDFEYVPESEPGEEYID